MTNKFIPIEGQCFNSVGIWEIKGHSWLTSHDRFSPDFEALCFDQKFRPVIYGADFYRADKENAFPVFWVWPDQWELIFKQFQFQKLLIERLSKEYDLVSYTTTTADIIKELSEAGND